MITLRRLVPEAFLRTYVVAALVAAVVLSPLAYSVVPAAVLLWYVFQWRRRMRASIGLISEWFAFISVTVFLSRSVGVLWSVQIGLPILLLVVAKLEESAVSRPRLGRSIDAGSRGLTDAAVSLLLICGILLVVALLVGSVPLAAACGATLAVLAGLGVAAWLGFSRTPVVEIPRTERMVAGSSSSVDLEFRVQGDFGGRLALESPCEWARIDPSPMLLDRETVKTKIVVSPSLSGPATVNLGARAVDRLGLVVTNFELQPLELNIIPRARYATWVVQKYIAGSRSGTLPLFASVGDIRPTYGWRRGIEFYGTRLYQPGDGLKSIDWKHSLQTDELTSKEFAEFGGRSAVLLVNLAASNPEQADKLAYAIASTALSFARESIPAALAAYDRDEVKIITPTLGPNKLLSSSLRALAQLGTIAAPQKYLSPPDVGRLRANIARLSSVHNQASDVLGQLLKSEYESLKSGYRSSVALEALTKVMGKVDKDANVVVIAAPGEDADALEFVKYNLRQQGNHVMTVDI